jgi:hypothetical protein
VENLQDILLPKNTYTFPLSANFARCTANHRFPFVAYSTTLSVNQTVGMLLNDGLKMIWDEAVVNHEKKTSVLVATIGGDSKQALLNTGV